MVTGNSFWRKLHLLNTVLLSGFQSSPGELWNPLTKAEPGKFYRSVRHSKCNCLQDQVNFHRSRTLKIVLIFNTLVPCYIYDISWKCYQNLLIVYSVLLLTSDTIPHPLSPNPTPNLSPNPHTHIHTWSMPGDGLSIKTSSYQYRNSHYKDGDSHKTILSSWGEFPCLYIETKPGNDDNVCICDYELLNFSIMVFLRW